MYFCFGILSFYGEVKWYGFIFHSSTSYCNDDKLDKLPEGDWWVCEDCRKSPGISSRSYSSANRHGVHSLEKDRVFKMSAKPPKPCHNTLLYRDFSCKTFKNVKAKATKDFTSELQTSCNCQKKAKVPYAFSDKRCENTLEVELDRKRKALETRSKFLKACKPTNKSLLSRESLFKKLGKANPYFLKICWLVCTLWGIWILIQEPFFFYLSQILRCFHISYRYKSKEL